MPSSKINHSPLAAKAKPVKQTRPSPHKPHSVQSIFQRAVQDPTQVPHSELLQLQRAIGSRRMEQLLYPKPSKKEAKPSMVQRFMKGTRNQLIQYGGEKKFGKSTYTQILSKLKSYEKVEGTKQAKPERDLNEIFSLAESWMDDEKHKENMENEEGVKGVGRGRAMGYLMGAIAGERGLFRTNAIDYDKRDIIKVYMGQGVVANLGKYMVESDEFYSCAPIVMFNENTHVGGLYHFPASALKVFDRRFEEKMPSHKAYLLAMGEAIQPTHIYVHLGGDALHSASYDTNKNERDMIKGLEHEQDVLVDMFRDAFSNAHVAKGSQQPSRNFTVTLESITNTGKGLLWQEGPLGTSGNYIDLFSDQRPSDTLRFGHKDAGARWKAPAK